MSEKLRLCPDCFELVVRTEWLDLVGGTSERFTADCFNCGSPEAEQLVFVPYYERGQERQDLFGRLCGRCLTEGLAWIFGALQPQERASEPVQVPMPIRWKEGQKKALSTG